MVYWSWKWGRGVMGDFRKGDRNFEWGERGNRLNILVFLFVYKRF